MPPTPPLMCAPEDPAAEVLQEVFGHAAFRPGQREAIDAVCAGKPLLAIMPTGGGKSLCYQLPALLLEGLTLVVSPLIALMKDQVDQLRALDVGAAYINSSQTPAEQREVMAAALAGDLKLLYVAPERFRSGWAMQSLARARIALLVIDEAHCISQWGHDFRPDYLQVGQVAAELGAPRLAAFTATATHHVRSDIVRQLGMVDAEVMVHGFARPNLHLSVIEIRRMVEKRQALLKVLAGRDGAAIIYCATRRHTEEVAGHLRAHGVACQVYHGGLEDEARREAQDRFQAEPSAIMVATNAFGMGVDKRNVRALVHWDLPGSVDAYYQEAGRAGRDGAPARCVLLFTYADTRIHEFFISRGLEEKPRDVASAWEAAERQKLKAMVRYAYEEGCRHGAILAYFGDHAGGGEEAGCGACDRCTDGTGVEALDQFVANRVEAPARRRRGTSEAAPMREIDDAEAVVLAKLLSAVARSRGRLTATTLAQVVRGRATAEAAGSPLAASASFGVLSGAGHRGLMRLLKALDRAGCVTGRRPRLTDLGKEVMWQRVRPALPIGPFADTEPTAVVAEAPLGAGDAALLRSLKEARKAAALERGVPAYRIATDRVLRALIQARPEDDRGAWLEVRGIGERNVDPLREVLGPLLTPPATMD